MVYITIRYPNMEIISAVPVNNHAWYVQSLTNPFNLIFLYLFSRLKLKMSGMSVVHGHIVYNFLLIVYND